MKKLLLIFCASLISSWAVSQVECGKQLIPSSVIVKKNDNPQVQDADAIWVCEDRVFDVQGNNNILFIEKNSDITISGDNNKVWVKTGNTITVTGDANKIVMDSTGVTYTDNGTNTTPIICNPFSTGGVRYNYTDVSSVTDCIDTSYTGIDRPKEVLKMTVYPNPVSSILNVTMHKSSQPNDYKIYSISGKLVLSGRMVNNPEQIDLSGLDKGLYFIELESSEGKISKRISVE